MNGLLFDTDSFTSTDRIFKANGTLKRGMGKSLGVVGKKWCAQCRKVLALDEFGKNVAETDGKARYCLKCSRQHGRVACNKRAGKQKSIRYERKEELVRLLGGKCQRCGYDEFLSGLDFHHVAHHAKRFTISAKLSTTTIRTADREELVKEINKCALLCRNCHASINEWSDEVKWEKETIGWRLYPIDGRSET